MTLGPAKHENEAVFRRKMSAIRMFLGFRKRETRRNPLVSYASSVKCHKPLALAHKWFSDFMTRHNMSIKAMRSHCDMRILCRIVGVRST